MAVGVLVGIGVAVSVLVGVGVSVGLAVQVGVGVLVGYGVLVGVLVGVGVGVQGDDSCIPMPWNVEGEAWLLYSVAIQASERATLETRTSSMIPSTAFVPSPSLPIFIFWALSETIDPAPLLVLPYAVSFPSR